MHLEAYEIHSPIQFSIRLLLYPEFIAMAKKGIKTKGSISDAIKVYIASSIVYTDISVYKYKN